MTHTRFYTLLALFTAGAVAAAAIPHFFLPIGYALPLTVGIILMFVAITLVMFYAGKRTAGSENKLLFTNVFMGLTMLKFFLCGGTIAAYVLLSTPENKLFIIPFFSSYIIYTVLEVIFLLKLSGTTSVKTTQQ